MFNHGRWTDNKLANHLRRRIEDCRTEEELKTLVNYSILPFYQFQHLSEFTWPELASMMQDRGNLNGSSILQLAEDRRIKIAFFN